MKVLLTGAGGFVGTRIVAKLISAGVEVVAFDKNLAGLPPEVTGIEGDLSDSANRSAALATRPDAVIHLATVPGGAAEADPALSRRVNIDAMYDLMQELAAAGGRPRFIFASSIAVFGDPFPTQLDDATPLSPKMVYGGHKAMMERAVAMFSNRRLLEGVSLRLSGILARPKAPSGLKSAFLSDLFHTLREHRPMICPTTPQGTILAQSVDRCAANFVHALACDATKLPPDRAMTLPALNVSIGDLVAEIARQCDADPKLISYEPDEALETAFARQPSVDAAAAYAAGFADDGDVRSLVSRALALL